MSVKKVLVIDDSTTIRQLCTKKLGASGYEVHVAETAEQGLEMAFAERPDMIILDHQLPGKTGYSVACELLADPDAARIPVVVSSSMQTTAYEEYIQCRNVVGVLAKPYTPEILLARVEGAINTNMSRSAPVADESKVSEVNEEDAGPSDDHGPESSDVAEPIVGTESNDVADHIVDAESNVDTETTEHIESTEDNELNDDVESNVVPSPVESDLSGTFTCFGLREIIDMLNHTNKKGKLDIECDDSCVSVFVERGRIQAVTASGIAPETVSSQMPALLVDLAPVLNHTVTEQRGFEIDGLIGLIERKVIDSRLLKKLLQLQAAILLRTCFAKQPLRFRFESNVAAPHLFETLPLDSSLLAILVEGALVCDKNDLPHRDSSECFAREAIRGQSLDRAGLSPRHVKLMSALVEPVSTSNIAAELGWSEEEVARVVHGFELAELIKNVSLDDKTRDLNVVADREHTQNSDNSMDCIPEAVLEGSTQLEEC